MIIKAKDFYELLDACRILLDDAEFFTGDVRTLTAWERFAQAFIVVEKGRDDGETKASN